VDLAHFFSLPRGNNDVNVLDKSPFVAKLLRGEKVGFMVMVHFIHAIIYWQMEFAPLGVVLFMQSIHEPQDQK
jgi:hypothetical protein